MWFAHGGSHHSVAIEMRDHVVLFQAPLGDGRVSPVLEAVKKSGSSSPSRRCSRYTVGW